MPTLTRYPLLFAPQGLKANMTRLYQLVTEPQFGRCSRLARYKKLLFALCFFHSLLLERRQFLQLGWNVIYGFNDSDFEVGVAGTRQVPHSVHMGGATGLGTGYVL